MYSFLPTRFGGVRAAPPKRRALRSVLSTGMAAVSKRCRQTLRRNPIPLVAAGRDAIPPTTRSNADVAPRARALRHRSFSLTLFERLAPLHDH